MESSSGKKLFIGVIVILAIGFGYFGWRGLYPEHDVSASISDLSAIRGTPVSITIENTGSKSISFWYPYEIWQEGSDNALYLVELNIAWIAEQVELSRGETWTQEIFTDLEPGKYVLVKEWETVDGETGAHSFDFEIK